MQMGAVAAPPLATLYVGDLEPSVTEAHLVHAFASFGPILSARLCRHRATGASLGYAYLNFPSRSHAVHAFAAMNHSRINGQPIRIMWSNRNPLLRKTAVGNLFVKNLDGSVDGVELERVFSMYGTVVSSKVATDESGKSKGFGFVQMGSEAAALMAIEALNGTTGFIGTKKLYVSKFVKKSARQVQTEKAKCTNLYIKNLDKYITKEVLRDKFTKFGKVSSAVVMQDELGKSRGFGFVSFESPEHAMKAMESMNGSQLGSCTVYVGQAQKKVERAEMLRQQFEARRGLHPSSVYVKNLDASVDEKKLLDHFGFCGKIVYTKVVRERNGVSRGFGFVSFFSNEEAKLAASSLNGSVLCGKILYVAIAWRKIPNVLTKTFPTQHFTFQCYPSRLCSYPYGQPQKQAFTTNQYGMQHFAWQPEVQFYLPPWVTNHKDTSALQLNNLFHPAYPPQVINSMQPTSYGHFFGPSSCNSVVEVEEVDKKISFQPTSHGHFFGPSSCNSVVELEEVDKKIGDPSGINEFAKKLLGSLT